MIIRLVEIAGEFCTRRNMPALAEIKKILVEKLEKQEPVEISTAGVKILTPSFIDELIPDLINQYGEEKVTSLISFNPPLEGFLKEQISRGVKNRKPR
ncbi:MAG: hypothetical protein COT74_01745 [Bdellovibrionales bacterium CG10_big_fil_rev_8_21_14_0_10_45_34]|nr:MAG: hypothetical protein COT74_01745 [Bdellovibrionales bacterium CG10_big_fil_rev_8_21_14_0_10_45_34]